MTGHSRKMSLAAGLSSHSKGRVASSARGRGQKCAQPAIFEDETEAPAADEQGTRLAAVAGAEYAARRRRDRTFGMDLFAEPAWDMLLDLYIQRQQPRPVSIHSLCIAAAVPQTTALRWIAKLARNDLLVRRPCTHDNRVTHVTLSDKGLAVMERYLLGQLGESGPAAGPLPTLS